MRPTRWATYLLAATLGMGVWLLTPAARAADTVVLKDGTNLVGKVITQVPGKLVVIETPAGTETIPWENVKRVSIGEAAPATTTQSPTATASPTTSPTMAPTTEPTAATPPPAPTGDAWTPATTNAAAPPAPPDNVHRHDGFYFRAGLGLAFLGSGTISGAGGPDISVSGVGPGLELAVGGTLSNGLVIGGGIYVASISSPSYSAQGASVTGGTAIISSIGPFIDWYINPSNGFHVQAAVGYAVVSADAGSDAKLKYPPKDESGGGYSLLAGIGYEWWVGKQVSLGVLGRLQYVSASVKGSGDTVSSDVSLVIPAILGTLTYH